MLLKELFNRCAAGEVSAVDSITDGNEPPSIPEKIFQRYQNTFGHRCTLDDGKTVYTGGNLTVEEDYYSDGSPFFWIYDHKLRQQKEFNPCKQ